jgi:glutathione peroxidase
MAVLNFLKPKKEDKTYAPVSFYDLACKTIDGEPFVFSDLKGKKILIVNVASKCGFTPQYEDLEKLFMEFGSDGFIILGFPSNDFLKQESGSEKEIKAFCQLTYGVSFPMMSKVKVKGRDKHVIYKWLTNKNLNGVMNSRVKWNFQKYMIDKNGMLVGMVAPRDKPYSQKILDFIKS